MKEQFRCLVVETELKQHLALGKCQSRDFDAQIADITLKLILYTLLACFKRISEYESLGALFEYMNLDMSEKPYLKGYGN